jgi:hypothetical protein
VGLNLEQMRALVALVKQEVANKEADYFAWVNPPSVEDGRLVHRSGKGKMDPTREISAKEALDIYKSKLDGVYGERFVLAICAAMAAIRAGKDVALLQIQEEPHAPFDAHGWLVLAIAGHPIFHISPSDLPVDLANKAGLVTMVGIGTVEAERYKWKGTTKADELEMLLDLLL